MAENIDAFRKEVSDWLEANCPASMRQPPSSEDDAVWGGRNAKYSNPDAKKWLDAMGSKGWTAPTWPKEYGGGGLSKEENKVLQEELRKIKARSPLSSFGLWMLGPVLLEFANEEQKKTHLPKIIRGEIRWCQGYSEPGAGSDLAGLQTRAVLDGDHYVINGQKVWTSYANHADWIFCLVRTDTSVKHEGISFILFDMETEGVKTSPIKLISGNSPFCETFFDNVRVPKENLVGRVNGGWEIAKRLLQHERSNISAGGFTGSSSMPMQDVAKTFFGESDGRVADAVMRERVAAHRMDSHAFQLMLKRSAEQAKAGMGPGAFSSVFKVFGAELNKKKYDLLMDLLGTQGLGWEGDGFNDHELGTTRQWLRSKANSIEGGTTEINLNVVSKRVLGLMDHQ